MPDERGSARARSFLLGEDGVILAPSKPKPRERWDFTKALKLARERAAKAAGAALVNEEPEPVQRARRTLEHAAPALVNLTLALTLGTDPEELDRRRGGVRVMADLAVRQLAAVGIKTGETVEHDLSERFTDAMARFFGPVSDPPRVLETDPGEPSRRSVPRGTTSLT